MLKLTHLLHLGILLCLSATMAAQSDAPKVFLDCQTRCYFEHIRTELDYVNFVRDRQESEVYLQLSSRRTGAGGREYTLLAIGQGRFEGMRDTTNFFGAPDITDDAQQNLITKGVTNGILPFFLKTDLARYVTVSVDLPDDQQLAIEDQEDPWNYWVFRLGGNMHYSEVETSQDLFFGGSVSASRVTNENKFWTDFDFDYSQNKFELEDGEEFVSIQRSGSWDLLYVKSISDHWSIGGFANAWSNTFSNYNLALSINPAIEYNLFPYAESTKRQFTFLYRIGPRYNNYVDSTIFNVTEEWTFRQNISIGYERLEPWGQIELYLNFGNYLHDFNLLSLSFRPRIEWNIAKGLNLDLGANFSLIRDQLNIVKSEVTDEERLLRIKQLKTNYRRNGFIGLSYRFGSVNNNVVNTRF
ncbi:MAG: hypothetical protein R3301_14820 [Saprospiraceae bacterium]|nr:hypothetical protein [Saprospiraceae bacterium]